MIVQRGIRINVWLQSNRALGAVAEQKAHPLLKLYDSGITMTINMDDLLLFKATLTDQYANLIEHDVFTFEEINEISMNSLLSRTPFGNITPFSNL
jgi:adenosine deaminase